MKSSKFFALAVVAVASVFSQATILSYSTTGYQFDGGQVYDGTYNYYYKYLQTNNPLSNYTDTTTYSSTDRSANGSMNSSEALTGGATDLVWSGKRISSTSANSDNVGYILVENFIDSHLLFQLDAPAYLTSDVLVSSTISGSTNSTVQAYLNSNQKVNSLNTHYTDSVLLGAGSYDIRMEMQDESEAGKYFLPTGASDVNLLFRFEVKDASATPEPVSIAGLAMGVGALLRRRRRA